MLQLRSQIYAFRLLARNLPVPEGAKAGISGAIPEAKSSPLILSLSNCDASRVPVAVVIIVTVVTLSLSPVQEEIVELVDQAKKFDSIMSELQMCLWHGP